MRLWIEIGQKFDDIGSKTTLGEKAWEAPALGRKNQQEMDGGNRQWWKRLERTQGKQGRREAPGAGLCGMGWRLGP